MNFRKPIYKELIIIKNGLGRGNALGIEYSGTNEKKFINCFLCSTAYLLQHGNESR